jgi:hypothetical protein
VLVNKESPMVKYQQGIYNYCFDEEGIHKENGGTIPWNAMRYSKFSYHVCLIGEDVILLDKRMMKPEELNELYSLIEKQVQRMDIIQ